MKNLLFLLLLIVSCKSYTGKSSLTDCEDIKAIVSSAEFTRHFGIKTYGDTLTLYVSDKSNINAAKLCGVVTLPSGQKLRTAKADFEVKVNESRPSVTDVPRIVLWKEGKYYRFFETATNGTFKARVKNGKVKDIEFGVF